MKELHTVTTLGTDRSESSRKRRLISHEMHRSR